jgi:nucleoside diphosphate kinase
MADEKSDKTKLVENNNNILLVEGKDEKNFFKELLKYLSIGNVQIESYEGKGNLKKFLQALSKDRNFRNIKKMAFVRDADEDAKSAFHSIKDNIKDAVKELEVYDSIAGWYSKLELSNNVISINGIRLGIYIMPDNKNNGTLEDLCIEYIKSDPVKDCVFEYIKCIECCFKKSGKTLNPKNKSKSMVYSYLSSKMLSSKKNAYSPSIGVAAQQDIFDFSNSCFYGIKDFLKKMFKAD